MELFRHGVPSRFSRWMLIALERYISLLPFRWSQIHRKLVEGKSHEDYRIFAIKLLGRAVAPFLMVQHFRDVGFTRDYFDVF